MCAKPWGVAFDQTNMWVACYNGNNLVRFNPANCTSTCTITASVDNFTFPVFVAYDGTNIWATNNSGSGTVCKFPAANPPLHGCTTGQSFPVGGTPYGVAFDTKYIWVANAGGTSNNVSRLLSTGGAVSSYTSSQTGSLMSTFVAFDGGNIWVSNTAGGTISKF
jgi:DNA-binding beta-propeller fold protein YncE